MAFVHNNIIHPQVGDARTGDVTRTHQISISENHAKGFQANQINIKIAWCKYSCHSMPSNKHKTNETHISAQTKKIDGNRCFSALETRTISRWNHPWESSPDTPDSLQMSLSDQRYWWHRLPNVMELCLRHYKEAAQSTMTGSLVEISRRNTSSNGFSERFQMNSAWI